MIDAGDWWSWTVRAVTPADPHIINVIIVATDDDVIVTWPTGARLIATTSRHILAGACVAIALIVPSDVTVAAAARGTDDAIDGHV